VGVVCEYFSGDYCLCPIPDLTIGIQALEHGFLCKKICLWGYVFFFPPCRCDSLLFQKLGLVSSYILKDMWRCFVQELDCIKIQAFGMGDYVIWDPAWHSCRLFFCTRIIVLGLFCIKDWFVCKQPHPANKAKRVFLVNDLSQRRLKTCLEIWQTLEFINLALLLCGVSGVEKQRLHYHTTVEFLGFV
jgi:hypothetical protein